MAMKPGLWAMAFFLLSQAALTNAQQSPLQWPVPPPGPPREPVFLRLLIDPAELAGHLKARDVVPLDARDAVLFAQGHLPEAVLAWSQAEETPEGVERVRSLLSGR